MKTFLQYLQESEHPVFGNLLLYHGSNCEFDEFDFKRFGQTDCGTLGPGFYLTGIEEDAQRYADNAVRYRQEGEPHVMQFRVSLKNPIVLDSNNASAWEDRMREIGIEPGKVHDNAKELMAQGYDSVIIIDPTALPMVREVVLYKPGLAKREA